MKLFYFLLIFSSALSLQALTPENQSDIIRSELVSAHTRAFGKDKLFKQPFTQKEIGDWNNAVQAAIEFVKQYGTTQQKSAGETLLNINSRLLSSIESLSSLTILQLTESMNPETVATLFQRSIESTKNIMAQEKNTVYFLESRKLASTMIEHLAMALEATMEKTRNDIRKIITKKSK